MGTEIHSKMHLPGKFYLREPANNVGSNSWSLSHKYGTSIVDFKTGMPQDEFIGLDREKLRQTILTQESMFRHQLNELHRLYRVQRNLMNEMESINLRGHLASGGTPVYSLHIALDDEKKNFHFYNDSLANSGHGKSSTTRADSIKTPMSINGVNMQSKSGPSRDLGNLNNCRPLRFEGKKLQRRLFDLELPADEYIDNEEVGPGVSRTSVPGSSILEISQRWHVNLNAGGRENSACNGDASSSNVNFGGRRIFYFSDLNEPVQDDDASGSRSSDSLGIVNSKEIGREDPSANLYSGFRATDVSENLGKKRKVISPADLHPENGRILSYNSQAGSSRSGIISSFNPSYPEDPCISFKPSSNTRTAHEPGALIRFDGEKAGERPKRTIFGVEIADRNHAASHKLSFHPFFPQADVSNSELSSIFFSEPVPKDLSVKNNSISASTSRTEVHYDNGFSKGLQLGWQESQGSNRPVSFGYGNSADESVHNNAMKQQGGLDCMVEAKPSKPVGINMLPLQGHLNEAGSRNNLIHNDGLRKREYLHGGLPWLQVWPHTSGEYSKGGSSSDGTNLDDLKDEYGTVMRGGYPCVTGDSSSLLGAKNVEQKTLVCNTSITTKILGFSVSDKLARDLPSTNSSSKSCVHAMVDGGMVANHVKLSSISEEHKKSNLFVGKRSVNHSANLKHEIDLNSVAEEEAAQASSSPRTFAKMSAKRFEIDLTAPPILESEGMEMHSQSELKEQPKSLQNEVGESYKDITRIAAEAIVAISSSYVDPKDHNICPQSEASLGNPLHWFADIVSSENSDLKNEAGAVSVDSDGACHCDLVPEGLDYFEYMTLNLVETKIEDCHYKPEPPEISEIEMPMARKSRRGQARRGRQRKDFQRDVLPGLTSLSKYEVTEDIQTFRGIIRATSGTCESGTGHRTSTKESSGPSRRGRRRTRGSSQSPSKTAGSKPAEPQILQPSSREVGLCEGTLTGWGKRTRRLPRQRCQAGSLSVPFKSMDSNAASSF